MVTQVSAAILMAGKRVLIAKRAPTHPVPCRWEFPGGKIEPGETPVAALARELKEELGLDVQVGAFFWAHTHTYAHDTIELQAYWATCDPGQELTRTSHTDVRWVEIHELEAYDFAPADIPIVHKLRDAWNRPGA